LLSPRRTRAVAFTIGARARPNINHAGNPAVLGSSSEGNSPVDRKLCALAFQRVCPDQTLCKIAYCEPQCQRVGLRFTQIEYDVAHIRGKSLRVTIFAREYRDDMDQQCRFGASMAAAEKLAGLGPASRPDQERGCDQPTTLPFERPASGLYITSGSSAAPLPRVLTVFGDGHRVGQRARSLALCSAR
jgi:hypothetical protein